MSVLDIGQHCQWRMRQYAVAIAGHYSRTINYVFLCFEKRILACILIKKDISDKSAPEFIQIV